jgi:hypothetical protein
VPDLVHEYIAALDEAAKTEEANLGKPRVQFIF